MRYLLLIILAVSMISLVFLWESTSNSEPELSRNAELIVTPLALNYGVSQNGEEEDDGVQAGHVFRLYSGLKEHFDGFISQWEGLTIEQLVAQYSVFLTGEGFLGREHSYGLDLFHRYCQYKGALAPLEASLSVGGAGDIPKELSLIQFKLQELQNIRYQYFSDEEYRSLFSDDEQFDHAALARLDIVSNPHLSRAQKQALLDQHFDALSEDQKLGFEASLDIVKLQYITQKSSGSNLFNSISAEFGEEVAKRYLARQDDRRQWQDRVAQFVAEQQRISDNPDYSEEQKRLWLTKLKTEAFTPQEIRRLQVYMENPELLSEFN